MSYTGNNQSLGGANKLDPNDRRGPGDHYHGPIRGSNVGGDNNKNAVYNMEESSVEQKLEIAEHKVAAAINGRDEERCHGALSELLGIKRKLNEMVAKQGVLEKQIRDKITALVQE